jgi:demethoxyubiquinone hydroxylase (CLK1/Coq7/Cat5 family)/predicted DCC family thiol-disulfide oxidoreductase YuxK
MKEVHPARLVPQVHPPPDHQAIRVCFDGSCPLCRAEISIYQDLNSSTPIEWIDVSTKDASLPEGLSKSTLMSRFHVTRADGQVLSGARAFVALWSRLPGGRWLSAFARVPGALSLMETAYRGFLIVRPRIQWAFRGFDVSHLPPTMVGDMRSNQAGETGAVWIYRGILAVTRDASVRKFARAHLDTERKHLLAINALLPVLRRSKILIAWRIAGFLTGLIPAMFGRKTVFATIAAVETFVEHHYQIQIDQLAHRGGHAELLRLLVEFQKDEQSHRLEATENLSALKHDGLLDRQSDHTSQPAQVPLLTRSWCQLVSVGSELAVKIARVI